MPNGGRALALGVNLSDRWLGRRAGARVGRPEGRWEYSAAIASHIPGSSNGRTADFEPGPAARRIALQRGICGGNCFLRAGHHDVVSHGGAPRIATRVAVVGRSRTGVARTLWSKRKSTIQHMAKLEAHRLFRIGAHVPVGRGL